MLQKLSIRNYALIDNLEIEFDKGLNIITGETGAGKSIVLGALSLILGQRAESRYFFSQEKKCIIEGTFVDLGEPIRLLFEQNGLDFFKENTLRREIAIDGKSRAFINDTPLNISTLKQIGEQLIAIHSQHATLEIGQADFQLAVVDAMANHDTLLTQYRSDYSQWKNFTQQLNHLKANANEARAKQDYEQYLFNELQEAQLNISEQDALEQELEQLTHAESIKRALGFAFGLMDDSETAALIQLKEAINQLQNAEKHHTALSPLLERLRSAVIELKDIAAEIEQAEQSTNLSPERLDTIQQRLDLLYALQQKHRVSNVAELLAIMQQLGANLEQLQSSDEEIAQLAKKTQQLHSQLLLNAKKLTENRKKAITKTEKQINESLRNLALPQASLKINMIALPALDKDGFDKIELLFSANAGQSLAPVGKVASGGELSRLMLAVKALLAQHTQLPTLIFDEIDTGISGETALKVGLVMEKLGTDMQIIAITHLPQIASKGNSHFLVYKAENTNKTTSHLRKLAQSERVFAIAEMLSGKNPGESALQHAKELLG